MSRKFHHDGGGQIDSTDLATILRERKKEDWPFPRFWTHRRPKSWAEAVKSILRREPHSHIDHH